MDLIQQNRSLMRGIWVLVIVNLGILGVILWNYNRDLNHVDDRVSASEDISIQERMKAQSSGQHELKRNEESVQLSDALAGKLQLSAEQCFRIEKLRSEYRIKERELATQIRAERDSMNAAMFHQSTSDALVRSLARRVADNEYTMEMLRYEQAQEFKRICTPEQAQKFEVLVREIRDYFRPSSRKVKRGEDGPEGGRISRPTCEADGQDSRGREDAGDKRDRGKTGERGRLSGTRQ